MRTKNDVALLENMMKIVAIHAPGMASYLTGVVLPIDGGASL